MRMNYFGNLKINIPFFKKRFTLTKFSDNINLNNNSEN